MNVFRLVSICMPMLISGVYAAEIVSWKTPIGDLVPEPFQAPGVIPLQYAPEESVFFQPGDELWDVAALFTDPQSAATGQSEWIVWNARSHRVIAKGEIAGLWKIHQRLRGQKPPTRTRLTLKLYEIPADQSPPNPESPAAATVSWLTGTDEFEVGQVGDTFELGAKGVAIRNESGSVTSVKITTTSSLASTDLLTVDTAFDIDTGSYRWFARDLQGDHGMDLVLQAEAELADGTPLDQVTLVQRGNETVSAQGDLTSNRRLQLADGRWVHTSAYPLEIFSQLIEAKPPGRGMDDPFSATSDGTSEWRSVGDFLRKPVLELATVSPPDELRQLVPYNLLDFRPWLQQHSPSAIEESSFIAYDPLGERVIAISLGQEDGLEEFDRYFSNLEDAKTPQIVVSLTGSGECRLMGISGLTASLTRTDRNSNANRFLILNPTFGDENPVELDLDYLSGKSADGPILRIKNKLQLQPDEPIQIFSGSSLETETTGVHVECRIIDPAFP